MSIEDAILLKIVLFTLFIIMEKELTKELIEIYRGLPCLWNPKDENYHKKEKRSEALEKCLEICKLIDPQIKTTADAMKKITNLRNCWRKEHLKVSNILYKCGTYLPTYLTTFFIPTSN